MISALGNTLTPSFVLRPLMWSGWKCEIRIVSMLFGLIPAAARFAPNVPDCGAMCAYCPPVPVSIRTSFLPVLTTSGVNGVGTCPAGWKESGQCLLHVGERCVAHKFFVDVAIPRAVVDGSDFKAADLVAVEGGDLFADWRRGRKGRSPDRCSGYNSPGDKGAAINSVHGIPWRQTPSSRASSSEPGIQQFNTCCF